MSRGGIAFQRVVYLISQLNALQKMEREISLSKIEVNEVPSQIAQLPNLELFSMLNNNLAETVDFR